MEIGNWLEKLDKGTDEFYLSINAALKHIQMANFVHMLFAETGTGGFKLVIFFCVCSRNLEIVTKIKCYEKTTGW